TDPIRSDPIRLSTRSADLTRSIRSDLIEPRMSQLTERPSGESAIETRSGDDRRPEGRPSWCATPNITANLQERSAVVKPLLKWAGGKRQLLPALRRFYPVRFNDYYEPFAGSAAVFFDLAAAGRLAGRRAALTDSNVDLIG